MSIPVPLPWAYQEEADAYTHIVRGPGNEFVLQLSQDASGKAEATARFIVRAVNAHDALLSALEDLVERIEQWEAAVREVIQTDPKHGMDLARARAAIALAKRETP